MSTHTKERPADYQRARTERQLGRVLAALADEPMTTVELSQKLFMGLSSAGKYIRILRAEPQRIYVSGHVADGSQRPGAVYSLGNLPDVPFVRKSKLKGSIYDRQLARTVRFLAERHSAAELAVELNVLTPGSARIYINDLRRQKRVYISAWQHPGGQGDWAPLYRIGCGRDAKKPKTTRADQWKREKSDPDRHERIKLKRRIDWQLKAAVKKPQNIFSALGLK